MVGRGRKWAEIVAKGEIYRPEWAVKQAGWDPTFTVFGQNALCTLVTEPKWQVWAERMRLVGCLGPSVFD